MIKSLKSTINIYLITEGSTDRELLMAILNSLLPTIDIFFLDVSSTQARKRGKHALLKYEYFAKFLHYGFNNSADIIIFCIDSDESPTEHYIGVQTKGEMNRLCQKFVENNSFYQIEPCFVFAVPVKTMDYWIQAISFENVECDKINYIHNIPRERIKNETYGERNVFKGKRILYGAIEEKIVEISKSESIDKLRCMNSFVDFEYQLRSSIEKIQKQ